MRVVACAMRALLLALLASHTWAASPAPDYAALPGAKAMAVVPGHAAQRGVAHGKGDDRTAAATALSNCQLAWNTACEIVWLNDEAVTPGAAIRAKAGIGSRERPLFLWRYASPTATVYLAGSVHLLKPSLYPLPAQLDASFAAADYLVLEVDSQALPAGTLQQLSTRYGVLPNGQTLNQVLPAPLHGRLARRLASYGIQIDQLARLKPALVMTELVRLRLAALGYLPEHGVESYFRARASGRPILQLETVELQMRLLFDQPLSTQIQLLADTLDQELAIEPLLTELLVAWLAGDDAAFLASFQQQSGTSELARAFNRQLLDERNVGMASRVASYLAGQGTYFVLAGAAHFVGTNGIVALLAERGLHGTRLTSASRIDPASATPTAASAAAHPAAAVIN